MASIFTFSSPIEDLYADFLFRFQLPKRKERRRFENRRPVISGRILSPSPMATNLSPHFLLHSFADCFRHSRTSCTRARTSQHGSFSPSTSTTSKRPLIPPPPPPFPRPTFRLSPPTHLFKPRPHPLVLLDPRSNWTPRRSAAAPPLSRPLNSAPFETKPSQLDISIQDDNSADSNSQEGSAPIQAVTICTSGIWNRLVTFCSFSFRLSPCV